MVGAVRHHYGELVHGVEVEEKERWSSSRVGERGRSEEVRVLRHRLM